MMNFPMRGTTALPLRKKNGCRTIGKTLLLGEVTHIDVHLVGRRDRMIV